MPATETTAVQATAGEAPRVEAVTPVATDETSETLTTGAGDYVFEVVPNWGQLPEGQTFGPTHGGVFVDGTGRVHFSTESAGNSILTFAADGTVMGNIGGNDFRGIHGTCLVTEETADGPQEFLYVAHLWGKEVVKLTLEGEVVLRCGVPMESGHYEDPEQYNPTGIAVGPDGRIYVGDGYGQKWIHIFDAEGNYQSSFGGPGGEPHQLSNPHGLALDTRYDPPRLLVCDREKRRLCHFDLDGNYLETIATDLRRPCAVSIHGDLVAIAELEARVTILNGDNEIVAHLGDNPNREQWANFGVAPADFTANLFTAPHGLSFDVDGNLYVMDWNRTGRVTKLVWLGAQDTE